MENNEDTKYVGIGLIWIGAGIGIGLTNIDNPNLGIFHAIISLGIILGAIIATVVILNGADFGKMKRQNQSDTGDAYSNLLLQLMTDEERQSMRQRLINNVANDGELFSPDEAEAEKQFNSH